MNQGQTSIGYSNFKRPNLRVIAEDSRDIKVSFAHI